MIRVNKYLLIGCFALAMGCGESSSGQSQKQVQTNAPEPQVPAAEASRPVEPPQQVAALTDDTGGEAKDMSAMSSVNYVEGTHYERLPRPVPTVDKNRIEVTEVFWYGCGHCFHFEPALNTWTTGVASDVIVQKSPAMWDKQGVMANHARIYYTAKALGVLDEISPAAFRALNVDKNPLRTEASIAQLFTDNGVAKADFDKTFKSFGVTSSVRQAEARQRDYRVQGTPELIVDGTYRVSSRLAGSQEAMLKITDFLIDKIRREKTSD